MRYSFLNVLLSTALVGVLNSNIAFSSASDNPSDELEQAFQKSSQSTLDLQQDASVERKVNKIPLKDYKIVFGELDNLSVQQKYMCATESSLRSLMATLTENQAYLSSEEMKFSDVLGEFFKGKYVLDGFNYPKKFSFNDLSLISTIIADEIKDGERHIHYHGTNYIEAFLADIFAEYRAQMSGKDSL